MNDNSRHRPLGIPWDDVAALYWPPGHRSLAPDTSLARALGCTTVAVRVARVRRDCRAWQALPLPTAEQIQAELVQAGIHRVGKV
jgi:hypothetical protein